MFINHHGQDHHGFHSEWPVHMLQNVVHVSAIDRVANHLEPLLIRMSERRDEAVGDSLWPELEVFRFSNAEVTLFVGDQMNRFRRVVRVFTRHDASHDWARGVVVTLDQERGVGGFSGNGRDRRDVHNVGGKVTGAT